jgi:glutamyl-Q tRNA(Asp) synthetase
MPPASTTIHYRGRFAPSPTGPLHQGSLVAALASWLDARAQGGEWLVRIEDLDPPRVVPGAADTILRTLEACGLWWDGAVLYQSSRGEAYRAALERLESAGQLYSCRCSRREVADSALRGIEGPVYPGTCRALPAWPEQQLALRVRTDDEPIRLADRIQGDLVHHLASDIGDFVVRRADGVAAYQLAVVVDDAEQLITDVVRGADLLTSTTRQIHLQRLLGLPTPRYAHLPVVIDATGAKLSKQSGAQAADPAQPETALRRALALLGLPDPPPGLPPAQLPKLALRDWRLARVPRGPLRT